MLINLTHLLAFIVVILLVYIFWLKYKQDPQFFKHRYTPETPVSPVENPVQDTPPVQDINTVMQTKRTNNSATKPRSNQGFVQQRSNVRKDVR